MRLIDADQFNQFIIDVPEDVFDACSFARGVEAVLDQIREAPTIEIRNGKSFDER